MTKVYVISKQDDRKLENIIANMNIKQLRIFLYGIARGWDFDETCSWSEGIKEWTEKDTEDKIIYDGGYVSGKENFIIEGCRINKGEQ